MPITYILINLHNKNTFTPFYNTFLFPCCLNHTGSGKFHKLCVTAFNDKFFYKCHYNYYNIS